MKTSKAEESKEHGERKREEFILQAPPRTSKEMIGDARHYEMFPGTLYRGTFCKGELVYSVKANVLIEESPWNLSMISPEEVTKFRNTKLSLFPAQHGENFLENL